MDGASSLRTLRWKQICAGALSAASLLAGHLVFGQDAQPIRRQGVSASGLSAQGSEPLAPILNARAMPAPASRRSDVSKSAEDNLPPVLSGKQLPKPSPSQATFAPIQTRKEQPAASAQPVATLELGPAKEATPIEKPSAVSPWMMDINDALAESGKPKSDGKADETPAEAKSKEPAAAKEILAPIIAGKSPAANKTADSAKATPLPEITPPTVQLGSPQPAVAGGRTAADLRKPTSVTPPAAQLNPFASQYAPSAAKSDPVASKAPEASKYGSYLAPPMVEEPKSESAADVVSQADLAEEAAPTMPAAEVATLPETTPPTAAPAMNLEATVAAKPNASPAHSTEAPVVDRNAAMARKQPAMEAPRAEANAVHHAQKGNRLKLAGYEPDDRAGFAGPVPAYSDAYSQVEEPRSQSDLQLTPSRPMPAQRQQPHFTQADAPRQLPGMPAGPFEMIGESGTVSVMVRRSLLLRTPNAIYRTAVVDPNICDVIQFTPKEISIIGKAQGSTHVTFWFEGENTQPITYLVKVEPDAAEVKKEEDKYKLLEDVINEMFPDSKIQLLLVADKLIVKGQAKDSEEATQIMSIIRSNAGGYGGGSWGPGGWNGGAGGGLSEGLAADVLSDSATGTAARSRYQVINMLRVPGVQQVALRVKIAELNRTAARGFGVDVRGRVAFSDSPEGTDLFFNSILNVASGAGPALLAQFDGDDISVGIRYLQQHGVMRLLSEPTLVTMSGRPATFVAGGEFAVPTVVGTAGLNAVTTDFRAFGAIISFLPTVVDKDRIRLEVSPEFSQINQDLSVGGTPGLRTRAVTTTVEMREGQTFAIAGLLEDNMNGTTIGDLPFLAQIFGRRNMQRAETELIILVTPELVHPMEAEEVPPLPGFDVTEPDNAQFFLHGKIEGTPTREYRSTVWPRLKNRYKAAGPAMTSGPFGHGQ